MRPIAYHKYGIGTLLVNWEAKIDTILISIISQYEKAILEKFSTHILEMVPAYHSLMIHFRYENVTHDELIQFISQYDINVRTLKSKKHWKIPVNYSSPHALAIEDLSSQLGLTVEEIIALHSTPIYTVHFIGFQPGFPYLSGLDKKLYCPRKSTPRIKVNPGSVAIGGQQTGIYPWPSPGGWHIIGHTDFHLFDVENTPPCALSAGDKIQFIPI